MVLSRRRPVPKAAVPPCKKRHRPRDVGRTQAEVPARGMRAAATGGPAMAQDFDPQGTGERNGLPAATPRRMDDLPA